MWRDWKQITGLALLGPGPALKKEGFLVHETRRGGGELVTSKRFTREIWIANARKQLVEGGIGDVKVDRLAQKMHVTRGSFYWHFENREDLLDALLNDWETRNYFEIAQVKARWARTEADLTEVVAIWIGEDPAFPAFDMAIRIWARKSSTVSASVRRIDEQWISLLQELFAKGGYDETESFVRARISYFHQIGYYALGLEENLTERVKLAPYYYKALTGKSPPANFDEVLGKLSAPEPISGRRKRKSAATAGAAAEATDDSK
jgi:AcrR family transcriptional regulator